MSTAKTNRIAEIRKARGLSQQELADRLGSHWVTISKLERGRMGLTQDWMERIATALEASPSDLIPGRRNLGSVRVVGEVRDDGIVHLPVNYVGETHEFQQVEDVNVESILLHHANSFWLRVKTHSAVPFIHVGDMIRVSWVNEEDLPELIGRMCVAELADHDFRIGLLARGADAGQWDLQGIGSATIHNIKPMRLGGVSAALFGDHQQI